MFFVANVGYRNLILKFGQNWVNNKQCIVVVFVTIVLVVVVINIVVVFLSRNLVLKLGPNQVINS